MRSEQNTKHCVNPQHQSSHYEEHGILWRKEWRFGSMSEKIQEIYMLTEYMKCGHWVVAVPGSYTGCNSRNVQDFGRVFLRSNYTDITQNTYIQI